jgi:hypothetical protein
MGRMKVMHDCGTKEGAVTLKAFCGSARARHEVSRCCLGIDGRRSRHFLLIRATKCWGRVCVVAWWLQVHSMSLSDAFRVKSLHEASRDEAYDTVEERYHDDEKSRDERFGALPSSASRDCGSLICWLASGWVTTAVAIFRWPFL